MTSEVGIPVPAKYSIHLEELDRTFAVQLNYWDPRYHSVAGALNRWAALAEDCDNFLGSIDEYLNDLGVRDLLHDALKAARAPLFDWLLLTVEQVDDIFYRKSEFDRERLMWGGFRDAPCHWWHRRLPPDDDLQAEIRLLSAEMHAVQRQRRREGPPSPPLNGAL